MTLKNLCSEWNNTIINFGYGYMIVWKNGRSWDWWPIFEEEYKSIDDNEFMFVINNKESYEVMEKAIKQDSNAIILCGDYLFSEPYTCKSLMEDIKYCYYGDCNKLIDFYDLCTMV